MVITEVKIAKENNELEDIWDNIANYIEKNGDDYAGFFFTPYERIKSELKIKELKHLPIESSSFLDIGCGTGRITRLAHIMGAKRVVWVDISRSMLEYAKKSFKSEIYYLKIDGHNLPFKNNSFDIVFTSTVLQHNPDKKVIQLLNEMIRISKDKIIVFEDVVTSKNPKVRGKYTARSERYYPQIMEDLGWTLRGYKFISLPFYEKVHKFYVYFQYFKNVLIKPWNYKDIMRINKVGKL